MRETTDERHDDGPGDTGPVTAIATQDVLEAARPSRDVFLDLADKWSLLLLLSLRLRGEQRFSELQRSVGGISRRMLSQTLRTLERDGLLSRVVDPDKSPPRVTYGLTALGGEAAEETKVLCAWTTRRTYEVNAARAEFDRTHTE
ncbi:helix-turn-helix domain-containing protein [Streptomyces flaveolus]|uniref:winged helix-turn-helix transcriptional regulator n=1 Tax=Streptomyces flaveolus TaxID=67297 RepID=UPI00339F8036